FLGIELLGHRHRLELLCNLVRRLFAFELGHARRFGVALLRHGRAPGRGLVLVGPGPRVVRGFLLRPVVPDVLARRVDVVSAHSRSSSGKSPRRAPWWCSFVIVWPSFSRFARR